MAGSGGKQNQGRAQTFAAAAEQIAGDFGDRLEGRAILRGDFVLDASEVVANEFKKFLGGQKRDGTPPPECTVKRRTNPWTRNPLHQKSAGNFRR